MAFLSCVQLYVVAIRDAPIIGSAIGFGRYLGLVDHIGYRFY